jgi:Pseudomonas avirulence D protein (AvrD)
MLCSSTHGPLGGVSRQTSVSVDTIDDLLGPARDRFFGSGYRKVDHRLRDVEIETRADESARVSASATVGYPIDWARKDAAVVHAPHVSSIDALVLGVSLCEAYLAHRYGLDHAQRARMWLRRVDIRAGSRPQENLAGFTVNARLKATGPVEGGRRRIRISVFECVIGTMKVRCAVMHEVTDRAPADGSYRDVDDLLGPADNRYFGGGYRNNQYDVRDVKLDTANTYAEAAVRSSPGDKPEPTGGLEGAYQPAVSMIDSIVLTAQLAEVILYRTDGLQRGQSDTMWLRSISMESPDPRRPAAGRFSGALAVTKNRTVELGGSRWRILDTVAYCHGIEQTGSVAHRLPDWVSDRAEAERSANPHRAVTLIGNSR